MLAPYLISGVLKLFDWAGTQAEVGALTGLNPGPLLVLVAAGVIGLQLGASAWLLSGRHGAWLAALALAGFTLAATFLAHTWWQLPAGAERAHAFNGFWEHMALVGALVFAGVISYREDIT
ncbi:putative membrane protein YphA (DoxX/SURF4 family) [Pelomonas saccharophila]|uniref:Membrane protein YphA (DoxX/SURF4 family) n=1 Tax=Roseateles saccharophilus TaxID=304 RepID=A0ABU1YKU9_ROSSA|nr:DoxX family membrane protein [Roseateles saccharophilus]MDR7269490.1 putative membrane protein YphA (DoxX/SURF4 family) [Roseateles saccharophilus]